MNLSGNSPQKVGSRRLLPIAAVQAELGGVHRTTIYGLVREGGFPQPVKIGGSSRWLSDELRAWRDRRAADR